MNLLQIFKNVQLCTVEKVKENVFISLVCLWLVVHWTICHFYFCPLEVKDPARVRCAIVTPTEAVAEKNCFLFLLVFYTSGKGE